MSFSSTWNELVSLLHIATNQLQRHECIDKETAQFFGEVSRPRPQQNTASRLNPLPKTNTNAPISEAPSTTESTEVQRNSKDKLIPTPPSISPEDLSSTLKQMKSLSNIPKFSDYHQYENPQKLQKPWAIITVLGGESTKETFVRSVIQAIEDRLKVPTKLFAYSPETFVSDFQLACSDSDVILIFCSHHLESSFIKALGSIQGVTRTSDPKDSPFLIVGSHNHKPIRLLELHPTTHEDVQLKQKLWQRLKILAAPHNV
jgi:hypothetical protein